MVVSLGEENKQVEVPNVIGQDEATAKKSLNDQGLQVNVETTTDASGNVAEGCVANQSVAAGTSVDPGSTITLQAIMRLRQQLFRMRHLQRGILPAVIPEAGLVM